MEETKDEVVSKTGERRNINCSMAWFVQRKEGNTVEALPRVEKFTLNRKTILAKGMEA